MISGLDNVKKIWPNKIPQDSFSKLEAVTVSSCGQLLNIFPSCMLKRLQSLQILILYYCSSLEAVFDVEGTNVNVDCSSLGNTFVFPKITSLSPPSTSTQECLPGGTYFTVAIVEISDSGDVS